jgi:hypothetical protein
MRHLGADLTRRVRPSPFRDFSPSTENFLGRIEPVLIHESQNQNRASPPGRMTGIASSFNVAASGDSIVR